MVVEELEALVADTAARAGVAVVAIGRNGRGTGFVVAPDRVLTSAHNLRDDTVSVTFADGRAEQGRVHGSDIDGDLVVLDVPTRDTAPLELGEAAPDVGAVVVALGRGGHRPRATVGFVSARDSAFRGPRGRVVRGAVEHTAPLARGSSGGPVLDRAGRVVGINTHRIGQGFYLARATDTELRARVDELVAGRSVRRRTLGVAVAPADVATELRRAVGLAPREGVLVRGVEEGGPAARAGITGGDLLVRVGDAPVGSVDELQDALAALTSDAVEVGLVRGSEELVVHVAF